LPTAREARDWAAQGGLHGIGDSLYTPFSGHDGDDIDWDAYATLVRYCVGDLEHDMLWLTSGIAEWWALTMDERKKLVEVAIDEARAVAPDTVIQACTAATSAKDCVELTQHAEAYGADICYIQTPVMEVHAGEGVLRFFQYVAERTDIALGMFNSPSSGYVLTATDMAQIVNEVPAVVAVKQGVLDSYMTTPALHALAPDLVIWECNAIAYHAGWLKRGVVGPAQLGTSGWMHETPEKRTLTEYWNLMWADEIDAAIEYARESGMNRLGAGLSPWLTEYPGRPEYFTHWAEAFRFAASVLGLPTGDYPHSRPPQGILPERAKTQIRAAFEEAGMAAEQRLVTA
jgi:4-hydroxy-tetrahydrodipicolinate synthase